MRGNALVGVQRLVERDTATVAGNHFDCAGDRVPPEQQIVGTG